jgi:diketogulonate reductase-like aldo/keto reductase
MSPTTTIELANGVELPQVGLGVFRSPPGDPTINAVITALESGYRMIDTASIYGNEADVGEAIRRSGLVRSEVFVTTKVWNDDQGFDATQRAFARSLQQLGTDYVDLYLIHFPVPQLRHDTWRALEALYEQGRVRAIGVSNFLDRHLDDLAKTWTIPPMVNQLELSPFNWRHRAATITATRDIGAAVEAYSPLTKGRRLDHPTLAAIADRHDVSPAQVLLRWGLQRGLVIIPKSVTPERIRANIDLDAFVLSPTDMDNLDDLNEALVTGWSPDSTP